MSDEERQIVVFSDARPALANMVRNRLAEAGIEAFVENETLWQAAGDLPGGAITPRVVVAEIDAAAAREIVAEFRRESRAALTISHRGREHRPARVVEETPAAEPPPRREIVICPGCGQARITICPYCQTTSASFPAADQPASGFEDGPALVICQTCDEPFEPIYYRRCAWCGHDFGSGRETEARETVEYFNDRVTVAVMGMGLVLFAILAYFSRLLK